MSHIDPNNKLHELTSYSTSDQKVLQSRSIDLLNSNIQLCLVENTSSLLLDVTKDKTCTICQYLSVNNSKEKLYHDYLIINNSSTSFTSHFLMAADEHHISGVESKFFSMLSSAKDFNGYVVLCDGIFYSDAQNPHFYLHLLQKNSLPIEGDYDKDMFKYPLLKSGKGEVSVLKDYSRSGIVIKSDDEQWISDVYFECEKLLGRSYSLDKHPYLNFTIWCEDGCWVVVIFPRVVHKPLQYYENGRYQFKIIPGAIELSGVFCLDNEKYFNNLNAEIISNIYSQVSYSFDHLIKVISPLKEIF